jgi:hypothetical protein
MEVYIKTLLKDLESEIENVKIENVNYVPVAIKLIKSYIEQLKQFIEENEFKSNQEEIYYFKELKPQFCALLIYYFRVHDYQINTPIGSSSEKQTHIKKHLDSLTLDFTKHRSFYLYIISEETHLDEKYFLRENAKKNLAFETYSTDFDFRYCTGFDQQVAMLIAHKKLEYFYQNELNLMVNPEQFRSNSQKIENTHYGPYYGKNKLQWTESQSALTELIYALYESKTFNYGNTTVQEITKFFEVAFDMKISNIHRSFSDIKNRKNGHLKFLDGLVNRLNLYIFRSFQK